MREGRFSKPLWRIAIFAACLLSAASASAFEAIEWGSLTVEPMLTARLGLQYGDNINYGLGALDDIGETERSTLYLSFKPEFHTRFDSARGEFYGGFSFVAATTTLDGELSGQVARSGDQAFDTDHAYVGWRNDVVDISFGGQEFAVGDGLVIGDGNFNQGGENGQYWTGSFLAWRNSAILKLNLQPVRGAAFWLRSDDDLGDARVAGMHIETNEWQYGTLGLMYFEIFQGNAFNFEGMNVWNIRANHLKVPGIEQLALFGEWVREIGKDKRGGSRDNDAVGWYAEAQYTFATVPWQPRISYRYARFSGDDLDTPAYEEYRGLFFTIFKRDWDTWYQGEVAGEYHLFNQNQITQMFKLKAFPHPRWALTFYYYHHELEEAHYFGTPVSDENWADELNFGVEHFIDTRFYGYAGIAWSTPNRAAEEVFGNEDFAVIQTFLSYTF